MKIPPARAESFLAGLGDEIAAVLFHGPDSGLARERAEALTRRIAGSLDDPFLVSQLGPADLRQDAALLADDAASLSLTGGRRVVRVHSVTDALAGAVRAALERAESSPQPLALIVLEAGDLAARSSLRKRIEDSPRAASVGCYEDGPEQVARLIGTTLAAEGLAISDEARAWLVTQLGSDRKLTRSELEKLALYGQGQARLSLADCQAVIVDRAGFDSEEAVLACADGDLEGLDRALMRASREGLASVALLRAAQRHFQRLQLARAAMAQGDTLDDALKRLRPPPFFKIAARFRAQLRRWSAPRLHGALERLTEAEIACKSTGHPDRLIAQRVLMQLAHAARAGPR